MPRPDSQIVGIAIAGGIMVFSVALIALVTELPRRLALRHYRSWLDSLPVAEPNRQVWL